jgi:predicted XRE-type DNA-binding protein
MLAPDFATVRALRADLALQIARHVARSGETQIAAARRLSIPQPTLSRIAQGRVEELSLELLIRIAVRAGLPVVLQTGKTPAEAGAYVSVTGTSAATDSTAAGRRPSRLGEQARKESVEMARRLTPEQRLEAYARHNELVASLHRAGHANRRRAR